MVKTNGHNQPRFFHRVHTGGTLFHVATVLVANIHQAEVLLYMCLMNKFALYLSVDPKLV